MLATSRYAESIAHPPVFGQLSSPYNQARSVRGSKNLHTGVDIKAPTGTPVYSTLEGTVYKMYPEGKVTSYGNLVILEHVPGRLYSLYAHLDKFAPGLRQGQRVRPGQVLGGVGMTGIKYSAPHLHFEYLIGWPPAGIDRNRLDPGPILEQLGVILGGGAAHKYRKREQLYVNKGHVLPAELELGRASRPYGEPLPRASAPLAISVPAAAPGPVRRAGMLPTTGRGAAGAFFVFSLVGLGVVVASKRFA